MKTKFFTIVLLAFIGLSSNTNAQSPNWIWAKSAGGTGSDWGKSISTDANGNSYITGYFSSPTITFGSTTLTNANPDSSDIFVVKYDGAGNVLWAKSAGGPIWDCGNSISTDANGNSYITGQFSSPTITFGSTTLTNAGDNDIFVVKYDGAGNVLWAKSAGGTYTDSGNSISTDASGNSYITGSFFSPTITFGSTTLTNAGGSDIFVVKYDGAGNVLWAKSAGGTGSGIGTSISIDASGNSYITGYFFSPTITFGSTTLTNAGSDDIFVVKYDGAGNVLWAKSAGGTNDDYGNSISTDANGNSYITGSFTSSTIAFGSTTLTNTSASQSDLFVVKYDGAGNVLWAKSAGGNEYDYGYSISTNANGNSYITGGFGNSISFGNTTLTSGGSNDIFVVKYDGAGNVLWAKSAGGTYSDFGSSISIDANGNSYITGGFSSPIITFGSTTLTTAGYRDVFLVKLDNISGIAEDNEPSNAITIFPNPSNGKFTVNSKIKISKIEVINVQGKKVYTSQINTTQSIFEGLSTEIDLSNESKGIYFVNIIAGEKTYNSKIIIQ